MSRTPWFALALLAVAVLVPAAAHSQGDAGRWRYSLKCGAFFPGHGVVRDQARGEWWYVGLNIDPGFRYKPANGTVTFGADFDFRQAEGRGVFTIPLLAKVTWPITSPERPCWAYGGLGPGAYFINSRYSGAIIKPGIQFIAGLQLGEHLFLETAFDWVSAFYDDQGNPLRADGVKIALGVRF